MTQVQRGYLNIQLKVTTGLTMTNKAYIVANEQQEREVLEKLELEGVRWYGGRKPTEFIPKKGGKYDAIFPYALTVYSYVGWLSLSDLTDEEIVFDGRKEEKMSEKYVVSQEFMTELEEWKNNLVKYNEPGYFIDFDDLNDLSETVYMWWEDEVSDEESNNRLIAIIRWVNGEDVFEIEKPKKWVVRYKETDCEEISWYIFVVDRFNFNHIINVNDIEKATEFDTKEEAESWANAHQEVVEVVDV